MKNITKSTNLFSKASQFIPGGVNSPVRSFNSVGGTPIFIEKAKGAYLFDEDGNKYIDLINSWGPMILGHNHYEVVNAIKERADDAISFGTPTRYEVEMAELICTIANIDMVRLVCSGTEACMSAIRLARAYTQKDKFIKFEGCYHGHSDAFLVKAGSGVASLDIKNVSGVTNGAIKDTLLAPYNNLEALETLFTENKNKIAAIIIEPVAGNMGCITPKEGYLKTVRALCDKNNCLLIFDEVMTGFRLTIGGVQQLENIKADLVTYGKVIGGGLPIGAFGGKKEIMKHIAPSGAVYQAGTLSGNPIAISAGYKNLKILQERPEIYVHLEKKAVYLKQNLTKVFNENNIKHTINQVGSMMSLHFGVNEVYDFETSKQSSQETFNKYFHHMLQNGVHLPPSSFESWFLSDALSQEDLEEIVSTSSKFKI
jgi:glutamate-1-semialdehyde 2,1-aminomutase